MDKISSLGSLFLAGGGNENDSRHLDEYFLNTLPRKTILYVPVAMTKTFSYEQCYDWITSTLPSRSQEDVWIEMATRLDGLRLNDLDPYDAVYLGGGNAFSLRDTLRRSGFDKVLKEFFNAGKSIYGGSAGAIVLGKTIETAKHLDPNDAGLTNMAGLALAQDYSIWPHYQSAEEESIELFCMKKSLKVIAIPEKGGVVLSQGALHSIGQEASFLFRDQGKQRVIDEMTL